MSNFYVGVVEDRHDPLSMGRVRVRVLGLHSADRINEVPINMLPWSMVMMPANTSTTSGGVSQLVEGTWVLVMYHDVNLQDPIVIGSLPSTLGSQVPDYSKGFTDPFGVYPKWSDGTADTSLAAKPDTYTEHPVYTERARMKVPSVPIAKRSKVSSVAGDEADAAYERGGWAEPELRGGQTSQYPYNAVTEYEGGILQEFDSSPGAQRITTMHPSGSYDEIVVDGSRTIKVVGDGYEIILGNKNMYIKGDISMTVDGSMSQMVKGDYTLEVGGNLYQTVIGSSQTKILGNDVKEVGQDVSVNIAAEYYVNCGRSHSLSVGTDKIELVAGTSTRQIGGGYSSSVTGDEARTVRGNYSKAVSFNSMEITNGFHNIETFGPITIDSTSLVNVTSANQVAINAGTGGISLTSATNISQIATTKISQIAGSDITSNAVGTISITAAIDASMNAGVNASVNAIGNASIEAGVNASVLAATLVDVTGSFVVVKGPAGIDLNPPG